MKKIVLINGLIAAALIAGISAALLWSAGPDANHAQSEWLGYLVMIIGLSMIFVGIKQHRDNNLGGVIGFGTGFQVGLFITLIASAIYVLSWEAYYQTGGQDFIADYQASYLEQMRADGADAEEIDAMAKRMDDFAAHYQKWYVRWFITLTEIFPVGLGITLISSLLLRTRRKG